MILSSHTKLLAHFGLAYSHDFLGRSAGRDSFVIWTHNMKNITVHTAFTPAGAPTNETAQQGMYDTTYSRYSESSHNSPAITLDAGVQWHEAYAAADAAGRVLVGGVSADGSVGAAGGWMQGGGHSALAPTYGLGQSMPS